MELILDCYTDEPSGLGAPPYIGTHQRYLSNALFSEQIVHKYITIDDLRYNKHNKEIDKNNFKMVNNLTKNKNKINKLLNDASTLHIVMGSFIKYEYFSSISPTSEEIFELIKNYSGVVYIYYVLGIDNTLPKEFKCTDLYNKAQRVIIGNPYVFIKKQYEDNYVPDYNLLKQIIKFPCQILFDKIKPSIIEIETFSGCNYGKCSFCVEAKRRTKIIHRNEEDIIDEVEVLYNLGARHFRFGKQTSFYFYKNQSILAIERLLKGIRDVCPDIETLHIDNVNITDVVTKSGIEITKLIVKYCTPGNIANFGIESFDSAVRRINTINGTLEEANIAFDIICKYGAIMGDDGQYKFLPGVNLLYGLNGQTNESLDKNISFLKEIMSKGVLLRRIFLRKVTSPFGAEFGEIDINKNLDSIELWKQRLSKEVIMPMQKKAYPVGLQIFDLKDILYDGENLVLRKLGTCPERFIVKQNINNNKIKTSYNIKIIKHLGERKILCDII